MAQAKKKSTAKSKKGGSQGNQPLTILIILTVVGGGIFGLKYVSDTADFEPITFQWETSDSYFKNEENNKPVATSPKATSPESIPKTPSTPPPISNPTNEERMIETVETNEDLPTYTNDDQYYFSKSFDFAWPKYDQGDQIIEHEYYTLKYNEKTEQADWVAYSLTADHLKNAKFKRKDDFRADPAVQSKSAHPNDYKGSGYDRGHLAPAADFTWDEQALSETFFMSNMSPQAPGFNRGIWKKLEEKVRDWAMDNNQVFVVTGPIYTHYNQKIGSNKVVIPQGYYKVILELDGDEVKAIAFALSNEKSNMELYEFAKSVDELERETGMDFFPAMPDDLENKIESYYNYSDW
ncbi:hypothetical protein BFP72_07070 [Reichenbachiella sp. 5M10]|uniref:DNA/RNA non-specific endonuclease n=1 Tax=Reichenbachiella sp. 5M10 TaxID=1889772 RepID=UPI000C5E8A24|nr:DNA/RNA non-specific endonuclease [Reichenbachiella sp. 5M10]PIB35173.1 hypothetical protein BFP72_07070 [Reichenbachiella sp. 5M10]